MAITEDYVSFETAKLLKEKGFDGYTHERYGLYVNGKFHRLPIDRGILIDSDVDVVYTALTHQMAMRWLREEHKLFISIYPCYGMSDKLSWSIIGLDYDCDWITKQAGYASRYEEAVEAAIKYCLENLI